MTVRVEHGDCLQVIPRLVAEGMVCDAIVTDPPYHLTATQKRFGAADAAPAQHGRDGAMARLSGGFMGQTWDGGDIAFRPETWATVATILRPGAFLVAFGGTRTYHRLACAIEDGGFVIQDCIMWLFATGFPKRRDMLKPAYEPIVLAYKPGGKRTMQIDECRVGWASANDKAAAAAQRLYHDEPGAVMGGIGKTGFTKPRESIAPYLASMEPGRWPSNVCHSGEDEVLAAFDVAGERKVGSGTIIRESGADRSGNRSSVYGVESRKAGTPTPNYGDTGSAARFFFSAKAGAQDRWGSRHPTVKPVELIRWLVKLVVPPGGLFLDPFAGSGTAGVAALAEGRDAILIERDPNYLSDIQARMAFYEGGGGHSVAMKARNARERPGTLL